MNIGQMGTGFGQMGDARGGRPGGGGSANSGQPIGLLLVLTHSAHGGGSSFEFWSDETGTAWTDESDVAWTP